MGEPAGVVLPVSGPDGARSSSALGRAVVADALAAVDPAGARSAEQETHWRARYLIHFRRLVEAGLTDPAAARQIALDGLASLHQRMRLCPVGTGRPAGTGELPLAGALQQDLPVSQPLGTAMVTGTGEPERELSLPYRGQRLRGHALRDQLDRWVEAGVIEPSCAEAVRLVAANPDWLSLPGRVVVALGAGAEMGPVPALLRWGADVVAVDLPGRGVWTRLLTVAGRCPGRLTLPVRGPGGAADQAGADLLRDLPAVARWLSGIEGSLVLGNYAYADGATHVRLAAAADVLGEYLRADRGELAWSFLATPTDVYAVPAAAVAHAERAYLRRRGWSRPVRWLSAGRLLRRNYPPGADPGIIDCLVPQQGPNYALAKRVQRWRATAARGRGDLASLVVAPMTRTRSVLKNRVLAAAYAGAHRFGVEVFDPATSNTLMAVLLVHDLCHPSPPAPHPWQDEAARAAHGGVWRVAYEPRSALGLAALAGLGGARH